jgi:pimeloyl-ACP methyl ester carboxylesterase
MLGRRELIAAGAASMLAPGLAAAQAGAASERGYVRCRFGQLHVRRAGRRSARPPLLMFHQVPNSGQIFEPVLPLLSADRLVLAPDTPGYGMSDPAPDPQTIGAYADAMGDAIAALKLGRVDLVGYHTGAAIAAELATRSARASAGWS